MIILAFSSQWIFTGVFAETVPRSLLLFEIVSKVCILVLVSFVHLPVKMDQFNVIRKFQQTVDEFLEKQVWLLLVWLELRLLFV
jgi:hypothetical protein